MKLWINQFSYFLNLIYLYKRHISLSLLATCVALFSLFPSFFCLFFSLFLCFNIYSLNLFLSLFFYLSFFLSSRDLFCFFPSLFFLPFSLTPYMSVSTSFLFSLTTYFFSIFLYVFSFTLLHYSFSHSPFFPLLLISTSLSLSQTLFRFSSSSWWAFRRSKVSRESLILIFSTSTLKKRQKQWSRKKLKLFQFL